ncbi:thioesterase family protein [Gordonia sp. HY285]|uniref:acyl-CoA thioesterase domain-containing protein n=1 Tax=Gordonia liuliyuniae TaxID=2911517 RepID=UPI001F18DFAF|nr:acyl-CoA thioesterase domain-containing protein [Gordonia liuliyuniae]MCF8609365.1 thioesterase family protein [Gordonia liuliyuniae]
MSQTSFFTPGDSQRADPTRFAMSLWGPDALNGPAVCGLAAYAAERDHSREGWLPARFTLELFKSARRLPTSTQTQTLRDGRRIRVVQVSVRQHDENRNDETGTLVAQGNVVFLKQGDNPPGARWSRADEPIAVPATPDGDFHTRFADTEHDWSSDMGAFQNGNRRRLWSRPINVLPDEPLTAFQRAVIAAEGTSLATNWGEGGIGFINCDLTVALSRLPEGDRVGVESDSHLENAGVSAGTANLFDEHGQFGIGLVTAVDNTRAMIDFREVTPRSAYSEDSPFVGDDRNV